MERRGIRKFSTNHLMGQGYWVWLILLSSGPISIGIVADPRFHPFDEMNDLDSALDWIKRHEPQLGGALEERRDEVEDFLKVEDFAYGCERVYSPERWALTGIAGVFLDPFYSPGSDYIGLANTMITELIKRDLEGEDVSNLAEGLNLVYLLVFDANLSIYTDLYQLWGNAQVMSAKLGFDFALYWSSLALRFFHEKWTDLEWLGSVGEQQARHLQLAPRVEALFRDWHELDDRQRGNAFISNRDFTALWQRHLDLQERLDDDALRQRFAENTDFLDAIAVIVFHKAAELLDGKAPGPDVKINPLAVSLDPGRWEEEGLLDESGMSLEEARAKAPGIETLWLGESALRA